MPVEEADLEAAGGQPETYSAATYSFPVVILGGGFAGAYCARALSAGLGQPAALVADQNVMLWLAAQAAGEGDPVYDIGDPAFSFYVVEKGQVDLRMKTGRCGP